jgi:hypothetical protein
MLLSSLKNLFSKSRRPVSSNRPARAKRRLGLETLEDRQMPSGFNVVGDQLQVTGTGGSDFVTFTAGPAPQVTFNEDSFTVNPDEIHSIVVDGAGGKVWAMINDTTTDVDPEFHAQPGLATMTGANYTLTLNGVDRIEVGGSAHCLAVMSGSTTTRNDFYGSPNLSTLNLSGGSQFTAVNFGVVQVYSTNADDQANLNGSNVANSSFTSQPGNVDMMTYNGDDVPEVSVSGFGKVFGYGGHGTASDTAYLHGSPGSTNYFTGSQTSAYMQYSASFVQLENVSAVYAYAGTSSDTANFYGTTSSPSHLHIYSGVAILAGDSGALMEGYGFHNVTATAGTASDYVWLYGSESGANTFTGNSNVATLSGPGLLETANGYATVYATRVSDGDKAVLYGSNTSTNTFESHEFYATLSNNLVQYHVGGFHNVEAHAGTAWDHAELYGSTTSTNYFTGDSTWANLVSTGYVNTAVGFRYVNAYNGTSSDVASLYGATTPGTTNTYIASSVYGDMYSSTYQVAAMGFSKVYGFAGHAWDKADLYGSHFQDLGFSNWAAYGSGYYNAAYGFDFVSLHAA